ncbi:hypothetical protein BJX99DRAFT_218931 [Aspergillus californicus]
MNSPFSMPHPDLRQIRRPRVSTSCIVCRSRKVRCGRERPECGNCKKMNKACEYQDGIPRQPPVQSNHEISEPSRIHEAHIQASASKETFLQAEPNPHLEINSVPVPGVGAKSSPSPAFNNGRNRERPITHSLLGLANLHELTATEESKDPFPAYIDFLAIGSVLRSMPMKTICDALVESFRDFVYPLYPLIDITKFQAWYDDFWKWCGDSTSKTAGIPATLVEDMTSNCLLFAVLYAGASAAPEASWTSPALHASRERKEEVINELNSAYTTTLTACAHLEHPTISTIISKLLADPFMGRELDALSNGLFISTICRLGQSIGLHRNDHGTPDESHTLAHRVWGHIVWLDVQSSISSGLPPVCSSALSHPTEYPPQDSINPDKRWVHLLHLTRIEISRMQHHLLGNTNSGMPVTGELYQELVQDIRIMHQRTRAFTDNPSANPGECVTAFSQFATGMLKMAQLEAAMLVHMAPTSSSIPPLTDQYEDEQWPRLVRLCLCYLQIYISMTENASYKPYLWYLSRCAGPLQCTYLLLMYLRDNPASKTAELGRGCLQRVFNHWNSEDEKRRRKPTGAQRRLRSLYSKLPVLHAAESSTGTVIEQPDEPFEESRFDLDMDFLNEIFNMEAYSSI